jgi:3-hydroxyisobutyrate dehydrogenase-like beta-hydroxyacid dehydrogenase
LSSLAADMASLLQVLGEAYALAESHGLAATQVLEVLKDSMLSPEVIAAYGERIADRHFEPAGFRLKLGLKDVDLALHAAEEVALPLGGQHQREPPLRRIRPARRH